MTRILFSRIPLEDLSKAHVKGHLRDGVWVKPYETKSPSASPYVGEGAGPPKGLFGKLLSGLKGPPKKWFAEHTTPNGASPDPYGPGKPKPKPKPEGFHPQQDDKGDDVGIYRLSKPTPLEAFKDPDQIATVCPGGPVPAALHGVKFAPWDDAPTDEAGWAAVPGQADIEEPEFEAHKGKKIGAGVIVQEPDGRVWVIHPTNQFGGYKGTFPKGTVEDGLGLQASAIKEAFEESGLQVEITGFLMDVERTTSKARFYTARRVGGTPAECGWESQSVSLVPVADLYKVLNMSADHGLAEHLGAGRAPAAPKPGGQGKLF